jgi:hypothetical protein
MLTALLVGHLLTHELPMAVIAIVVACRFCKRRHCDKSH